MQLELAPCPAVLLGPSCWDAEQPGHLEVLCSSPEEADGCTSPDALMQTRRAAGARGWMLVVAFSAAKPSSAHADANQGLPSTQEHPAVCL